MKIKYFLFWLVAIVVTLGAAIYQRHTGPTYPLDIEVAADGVVYANSLTRSHGGLDDCPLEFAISDVSVTGRVSYRRFPTQDGWTIQELVRKGEVLVGTLPHQAPAGKIEYKVDFYQDGQLLHAQDEFHTVVRYKGDVPAWVLIPHIFFMFFAMLLSNYAAILAIDKHQRAMLYTKLTLLFLLLGGLVFGPVVQLYAFGELWAGVPFGWDLTDNKTLIAFLIWLVAALVSFKQKRVRFDLIIAAAIIMLAIFSIPHSMFGSELDYSSGVINQG